MISTDIFKFEFVDRTDERQICDEFLAEFSKGQNHTLWLHGRRGTGKSYLLTEQIATKKEFTSVYVNIEADSDNNSPGTYLKELINQLNRSVDLKFTSYLRANYSSIATIGQKAVNVALNLADLEDTGLDELGVSLTNYFISKHGEKINNVRVVKKYIVEALKKCSKIVFLLDNFSQCDAASLDVIVSVIHELSCDDGVKFILCTTDDDLETRFDIKSVIAEKIPNKSLVIHPFQEKRLFARMLERTFDLNQSDIKLLSQAFDLCKGIPQQFKEILINLYAAQGITIDDNKAKFVLDALHQILIKGEISFDIDSFCKEQKGAKVILEIIAFWGAPISVNILYEFLKFYSKFDLMPILREETGRTLQVLEEMHVITRLYQEHAILFQFEHDSLKIAVREYFKNDKSIPFLHFNIYEYLMVCERQANTVYWQRYHHQLLAYHSFAAKVDGWVSTNYFYGYTFFESKMFSDAELIFSRLESVAASLTGEQLLTIGITYFYCGQYSKADDLLSNIQSRCLMNNFSDTQIINLYIFQARARSCMLDSRRALEAISFAENLEIENDHLRVALMGTKQSVLFLSPGGFEKAKHLFDCLIDEDLDLPEMALVYQSAMDYYEGNESQVLLNKGISLAKRFSDKLTEGKILNNIGFEYLRCANYEEADKSFKKSILTLEGIQPHEQVYPYSNLAVLHMISKNWEEALNDIAEALFWNKSSYASLVLKTNRMLCYYFSDNPLWNNIYIELFDYINSNHYIDDKIYKKICINLALVALKNKQSDEAAQLLDYCLPHLKAEWPHARYRFLKMQQDLTGELQSLTLPPNPCYNDYYCKIEFEPWLVNFSHD